MASLALATIEDLEARMGPVSDASRASAAIDDASNWIHETTNNVWIADGALVASIPGVALTICCAVARRVLENPSGLTAEAAGPFSASFANSSADLYITKAEQRMLRRAAGIGIGAITLESPYPVTYATSDVYVPWVDATSEAFPLGPFPSSS